MNRATVVLLFLGAALAVAPPCGAQHEEPPPGLQRMSPVECSRQEDLVIAERYIVTEGNAVEVRGMCDVLIVDSHIVADGVGVWVSGNGDVAIRRSYIEGASAALSASGNGGIEFEESTIVGPMRFSGNADIEDGGGNTVHGQLSRSRSTVIVGSGRDGGLRVEDEDGTTVLIGPGGVEVREPDQAVTIETGPGGGVVVRDETSTVVVENGYVRVEDDHGVTEVRGDWRIAVSSGYSSSDTDRILLELNAENRGGQIRFDLAGDVLFDFDSAAIRHDAAAQLAKVAHVIRERSTGEVRVIGHTDSVGREAYNQKLSERRAVAVMHWLNEHEGIPAHVMKGKGMGSKKPIAYNTMPDGSDNLAGRAKNRRVEITFGARR